MPKYTIDGTTLSDVADAVRELDGDSSAMTPAQMASRIRAVQPGGAYLSVIAEDYDSTATYAVGDYCIHEGGLYVCTTAISTAEAWTAGHWNEVTVGDELSDLKGSLNNKLTAPQTAGTQGQVLTSDGQGGQSWEDPTGGGGTVTDVQIDNTSVVTDGVANVPKATNSVLGVVKVNSSLGLYMHINGDLGTNPAGSAIIKDGTANYYPLVPQKQHESTFYGLAKAAGDTTQSASSNTVGTYTPEALKAIRKMLGIPNMEWEKIADVTVTEDSTEINIQTDLNGLGFKLRKLVALFSAEPSTTGARDSFYTKVSCYNLVNNSVNATSAPSLTYPSATASMQARIEIEVAPNEPVKMLTIVGTSEGNSQNAIMMPKTITLYKYIEGFKIYQNAPTKSLIPSGSRLLIFGIRYDD